MHKTPKETAANNLGLHLTELHKTIKQLQADLALSRREVELACHALLGFRHCPPVKCERNGKKYNPTDYDTICRSKCWQQYFTAVAKAEGKDGAG